jgi:hypothetical protein
VRDSDSLSIISKKERFKAFFFSRFSHEVTADDVEWSLKEKLSPKKLFCTIHKKFNTYTSFRVSLNE